MSTLLIRYGDIKGNANVAGYPDFFEAESFSLRAPPPDPRAGAAAQDFSISRRTDELSGKFFSEAMRGAYDREVIVVMLRLDTRPVIEAVRYVFSKCGISSMSTSGHTQEVPSEQITISYGGSSVRYAAQGNGRTGSLSLDPSERLTALLPASGSDTALGEGIGYPRPGMTWIATG